MNERWFSVEEIADHLGVSRDTVYGWITTREMPAHRVGRLWKFQTSEVDDWVRRGRAADEGSGTTKEGPGRSKPARTSR
jgi:excisionase family DNA binding protein